MSQTTIGSRRRTREAAFTWFPWPRTWHLNTYLVLAALLYKADRGDVWASAEIVRLAQTSILGTDSPANIRDEVADNGPYHGVARSQLLVERLDRPPCTIDHTPLAADTTFRVAASLYVLCGHPLVGESRRTSVVTHAAQDNPPPTCSNAGYWTLIRSTKGSY